MNDDEPLNIYTTLIQAKWAESITKVLNEAFIILINVFFMTKKKCILKSGVNFDQKEKKKSGVNCPVPIMKQPTNSTKLYSYRLCNVL